MEEWEMFQGHKVTAAHLAAPALTEEEGVVEEATMEVEEDFFVMRSKREVEVVDPALPMGPTPSLASTTPAMDMLP